MPHPWVRRVAVAALSSTLALALAAPAWASLPASNSPSPLREGPALEGPAATLPEFSARADLGIKMRNEEGTRVIGQMVADDAFWSGAWQKTYNGRVYDAMRLKNLDSGYLPMITGEGSRDYEHDVVAHVIFSRMHQLPLYMSGAKAVATLGKGTDPVVGAEYTDTFWFLDLTVLYVVYPMRMYRRHDPAAGVTYLWFEKLDESFVDSATWSRYQKKIEETKAKVDLRWPPFNSVNEASELYGIFVVSPGKERDTRVTFVSKLGFGSEAGWLAKFGSQLPGVLRAGLRNGFVAAVAIADAETERRSKKPSPQQQPQPQEQQ